MPHPPPRQSVSDPVSDPVAAPVADASPAPGGRCPFHPRGTPSGTPPGVATPWPPGPRAVTGWGLLAATRRDLLGSLSAWQAEFGDLYHLAIWPEHEIVVGDPALVRELLIQGQDALVRWERGMAVFAQLHGKSVFIAEGDAWRRQHDALVPSYAARTVAAFAPLVSAAALDHLARWPQGTGSVGRQPWPVESALTTLTLDVILRRLFSFPLPATEAAALEASVRAVVYTAHEEFFWPVTGPDWLPWKWAKAAGLRQLKGLVARQVAARLGLAPEDWPQDLLSQLLGLYRADPAAWPLEAVRDECMTALLAGHEATAATLTWWAAAMAEHPAMQARARAEALDCLGGRAPASLGADDLGRLPYLTQTLQETLRHRPAAPVLNLRRARAPIQLGPWRFPPRTLFLVPVHTIHHDPRWYPDPQVFNPERFAPTAPPLPKGAYLPFGLGPRVCLGQHLAMAEMTLIAALILVHHGLAPLPGATPPVPRAAISLRPTTPLSLLRVPPGE